MLTILQVEKISIPVTTALERPGRLLQRGRHNLRRQVEVFAQKLNALISQEPAQLMEI
jgi:hypothetical protein